MTPAMTETEDTQRDDLPLEPGEKILWQEKPAPTSYVKQRYGKLTLIGLFLLGFIIFGLQDVLQRDRNSDGDFMTREFVPVIISFALMTIIGIVLATSMIWGRKEAENTVFYLTDKKLMISRGISPPQILIYPPHTINHLDTVPANDGTGSLYFREEKPLLYGGLYKKKIGFEGIQDPSKLYGQIHKIFYK